MKLGITVWQNRISPLLDSAYTIMIVNINNGNMEEAVFEKIDSVDPFERVHKIAELGIDELICGAVSRYFYDLIAERGIKIIPFISGDVNVVLEDYLSGKSLNITHPMPGCGRRIRCRRRGRK